MDTSLYKKYRPTLFSYLIGQAKHNSEIIKGMLQKGGMPHHFLFWGDSGTGKTTAARILARAVNCTDTKDGEPCLKCSACRCPVPADEVNAAEARGIDTVREKLDMMLYRPMPPLKALVLILDECQNLSPDAMSALLKPTESTDDWVYIVFCTTDPSRLSKTLRSRLYTFEFKPPAYVELVQLLKNVVSWEKTQCADEVLMMVADVAKGNVRTALTELDKVLSSGSGLDTNKAGAILSEIEQPDQDIRALAKAILNGSLQETKQLLSGSMKLHDPEKVRITIAGYMRNVCVGGSDQSYTFRSLKALSTLADPLYQFSSNRLDMQNKLVLACVLAWYKVREA